MNLLASASKIAEGFNSTIYHLSNSEYGREVVLKVMKEDFNYYPHSSQLINEDKYLRGVKTKGVRCSLELIKDQQTPILVLEYFNGVSLKSWRKERNPSFIDCLRIAIQIAESLCEVHSKYNIIHRDISSHNILINEQMETSIIDFGLAINVDIKLSIKGMSDQLLGTLPYISPEQTGRVNHAVDYRSDLYSLGVVLYELFTGELPFKHEDPLEMIHSHLAIAPVAPSEINPSIPGVFSQIILKLMSKDVEQRYQSANGLLEDLKKCLEQAVLKVEIKGFELAENDHSGRFLIPSKIYGRNLEKQQIVASISNIGSGSKEITLVSGRSGTGKTSLIYEIHKPITGQRGFFIKGKHQQFQKDRPYQAITQAISGFITLLLSENEQQLSKWRMLIKKAIGDQGKLLTDLIPKLELIVGKQKKLPVLGINEAQNRFNYIFTQFIKVLATPEHPLVLFIDDLQWSDHASLKLLKNLIADPELTHLYFIGAYRDNEVTSTHPMHLVFRDLPMQGINIQQIQLKDLEFDDTRQLIKETFKCTTAKAHELTNVVQSKTAGNPFFVNQFLRSIYESGLIYFGVKEGNSKGEWQWDIRELENTNFTDNVVEFMVEKLKKMEPGAQVQLTLGACIGDKFELQTLYSIQEPKPTDLLEDLWQSVVEQLLVVEENEGDVAFINLQDISDVNNALTYRFAHDRVRQAAYELIPKEEKSKVHQQIGELLLQHAHLDQDDDGIFDIVNQLNLGIPKKERSYLLQLSKLNYHAGLKAIDSTAFDAAVEYLSTAMSHVSAEDWTTNYQLMHDIHVSAMESHYMLGNYAVMEELGHLLLSKPTTPLEKLSVQNIFVQSYIAQTKHKQLIEYGLSILKTAGIKLPEQPSDFDILTAMVKTRLLIGGKKMDYFEGLPDMEDESLALAINMMTSISTASYHNFPKLFPLVIFKSMQISAKNGNSIDSIPFYGGYGTILCGVLGQYQKGYEFGKLSLSLLEKSSRYKSVLPKTLVIYYCFINHWKDHLNLTLEPMEEALLVAQEIGDTQYAASAAFLRFYSMYLCGRRLPDVISDGMGILDRMESFNQDGYFTYHKIVLQGLINLTTEMENPWQLEGEVFKKSAYDSPEFSQALQEDQSCHFHIAYNELFLNFLFGNYQQAQEGASKMKDLRELVLSTAYIPVSFLYESLNCLQLARTAASKEKKKFLATVKSNQKKLKKWADHAPKNFRHKYLLVQAEWMSVNDSKEDIKEIYDECIALADSNEYLNELCIAYELAGRHFHRKKDEALESHYLTKALKAYRKWGAVSKFKALKKEFPYLAEQPGRSMLGTYAEGSFYYGSLSGNTLLDLASVLKAATTISSEIQLSKAIPTLLSIITENAGAQTGAFLLKVNKEILLHARCTAGKEVQMITPAPLDDTTELPAAVIQYVHRTQDTVILDNPQADERFEHDQYLLKNPVASLLCMPVIHQKKLLGIILLENRLNKGSFTSERTDLLSLLSGQIAITLHNALLYDNLEQKVAERTLEIEKQKEKLNRQNEQLTELNEEKDFLIGIVSHDLRNPLQLIKGYASMARMEKDEKTIDEFLGYVIESGDKMEALIKRILNVNAINSRDIQLEYSDFDLLELLEKEFNYYKTKAAEKNITFTFHSDLKALSIQTDEGYFSQVIGNLISNALKYTQNNGQVNVTLELHAGGDYYRVMVADNGQGIQRREKKLLFSKYQTLSSKPTGGEESTGIGLAIVKKYVQAMDGHIWCESEWGKGSVFYVEFPVRR